MKYKRLEITERDERKREVCERERGERDEGEGERERKREREMREREIDR